MRSPHVDGEAAPVRQLASPRVAHATRERSSPQGCPCARRRSRAVRQHPASGGLDSEQPTQLCTKAQEVLAAGGVAALILLGLLFSNGGGESQAEAQQTFCSSLSTLEGSVDELTELQPTSGTTAGYETAVDQIEGDWEEVEDAASDLADVTMSELDSAWDDFQSAVGSVPDDASVSDALDTVRSSAQELATTVSSTLSGPDCS